MLATTMPVLQGPILAAGKINSQLYSFQMLQSQGVVKSSWINLIPGQLMQIGMQIGKHFVPHEHAKIWQYSPGRARTVVK